MNRTSLSLVHIIDKLIKYALANKAFSANSQLQALRLTSIFHSNGIRFSLFVVHTALSRSDSKQALIAP